MAAGAEVEYLQTTNAAGTSAINLTGSDTANTIYGNAAANTLIGNGGNDILDGLAGADTLIGGLGDDFYFVDNAGDVVTELAGQGTNDRVFASASWTLTAGAEIEIVSTNNHAGTVAINLTGNELGNYLYGNAGANIQIGRASCRERV